MRFWPDHVGVRSVVVPAITAVVVAFAIRLAVPVHHAGAGVLGLASILLGVAAVVVSAFIALAWDTSRANVTSAFTSSSPARSRAKGAKPITSGGRFAWSPGPLASRVGTLDDLWETAVPTGIPRETLDLGFLRDPEFARVGIDPQQLTTLSLAYFDLAPISVSSVFLGAGSIAASSIVTAGIALGLRAPVTRPSALAITIEFDASWRREAAENQRGERETATEVAVRPIQVLAPLPA